MTTRKEHMQWCKKRALEYVSAGDLMNAVASMTSDLGKHDETKDLANPSKGFLILDGRMKASEGDTQGVKDWITGLAE